MRYIILSIALIFSLGNASNDAIQELVDKGQYEEAAGLAANAAEGGDAKAHGWLGWFYDEGNGVEANQELAVYHYRIAADGGENHARWRLGVMIDQGEASGDLDYAVKLFELAAEDGYTSAMVSLAVMQATGRGTPQDFEASLANYMRAAREQDTHGIQGVGVLFALGQGVPADLDEAAAWFLISAVGGNEAGSANFTRITDGMEDADINTIVARAYEIAEDLGIEMQIEFNTDSAQKSAS